MIFLFGNIFPLGSYSSQREQEKQWRVPSVQPDDLEREDRKRINAKDRALQDPFLQRVQEKQPRVPSV